MGTRNLTCIKKNGEYTLAKYCQWDGYYEGQGKTIVDFLRKKGNIEKLRERADDLTFISEDELRRRWIEVGANPDSDTVSFEVAGRFGEQWPELSRDTGGDILQMIVESEGEFATKNDLEFAADSLFCEFAYCIDFDDNTFSWYKGFNHKPLEDGERFAFLNDKCPDYGDDDKYFPVREVGRVPLRACFLPTFQGDYDDE